MVLAIASLIVFIILVAISKKRITKVDLYTTSLFAVILSYTVDFILGGKYQLYGYFKPGVTYSDFIVILGIYPAINMLFLNYFPFKKRVWLKAVYIILWSLFAIGYEWLAVKAGLFYHSGWKLWYSVPIYPILYLILLGNLKFTQKLQ
ncbi:CBO0543 family protein [Scopulibacillus cellulosilyticus]|uniref:CBO0543 family protein n=1 Tax=Scopulibacillus cellulosilyticus TaxID=2665665 RepID=A0ABW2Q0U7_9BACL